MSLISAQKFVSRMKEDKEFRDRVKNFSTEVALKEHLKTQGYEFDQSDLVAAMAACMTELDSMMQSMNKPSHD